MKTELVLALKEEINRNNEAVVKVSKTLSSQREDEQNFQKIKWNIIDIFEKMLQVTTNQSQAWQFQTELQWLEAFEKDYLNYFKKIPSPWQVNLEKCQQHGLEQEAHIETIKLETAVALEASMSEIINDFRQRLIGGDH